MIKARKGATGIFDHVICLAKLEIYIYIYIYINMMKITHNMKVMSNKYFQNQKKESEILKTSLSNKKKYFIHTLIVKYLMETFACSFVYDSRILGMK